MQCKTKKGQFPGEWIANCHLILHERLDGAGSEALPLGIYGLARLVENVDKC